MLYNDEELIKHFNNFCAIGPGDEGEESEMERENVSINDEEMDVEPQESNETHVINFVQDLDNNVVDTCDELMRDPSLCHYCNQQCFPK